MTSLLYLHRNSCAKNPKPFKSGNNEPSHDIGGIFFPSQLAFSCAVLSRLEPFCRRLYDATNYYTCCGHNTFKFGVILRVLLHGFSGMCGLRNCISFFFPSRKSLFITVAKIGLKVTFFVQKQTSNVF